ncbi:MAG TPA: carboxypeptidase-like regulatory domain-containing protein, partial [Terriglobales bacterium]|nr:carboxypeptidase-like regulatory domain-containing protein [Terriglobales bacterium]
MRVLLATALPGGMKPHRAGRASFRQTFVLTCLILLSSIAYGQAASSGTVTGLVSDASGAAIVAARVMASRVGGNLSRTATTDDTGRFSLTQIVPGRYVLHAEAPG